LAVVAADEALPPFEMSIERLDPKLDTLIAPGTKVEKLAQGFNWSEGPTWYKETLVFSDVPENIVYQWKPGTTKAEVLIKPSGLTKPTAGFKEQGSNGLTTDAKGVLVLCQHGDRRLSRYVDGKFEPIVTNFGRFGPYVKHGDEFRSLESDEQVFEISFDDALALIRAPKQSRRRQGAQKKTLRELTNDGQTLKLLAGRYGPYVTDGTTNASIPKSMNPEQLTWEQAQELLAARRDAAPAPKRGGTKRRAAGGAKRKTSRAAKAAEA
jgi:hypothetical protein